MTPVTNEIALTLVLLGMGLYFAVLTGRGLLAYVRFRRVRPTALLTWPCPRPPHLRLLLVLGAVSGFVTLLNATLGRPWPHVAAQLVMTFYFVVMVPLSLRVEWGLYADGSGPTPGSCATRTCASWPSARPGRSCWCCCRATARSRSACWCRPPSTGRCAS